MRSILLLLTLLTFACSSNAKSPTYAEKLQGAKKAFAAFDRNHDGVITRQEWTVMALTAAAQIPQDSRPQYVRDSLRVFLERDKNGDGKVTFNEYIADNRREDKKID